jgi:8-oxo-dGTP pyrophosphatase MutT (NUDIX family)
MHRKGVSALIINSNQEFLLVNLNSFEDKYFAIPGGGQEDGESLDDTVYREMLEELNIRNESVEYVGASHDPLIFTFKTPKINSRGEEYIGSERHFFGFKFIGSDNEIKLQENEVRSYKWVPFSDLKDYLLFDNQLNETLPKILEIFQKHSLII